jgi:4a-hydroxytetrahydrobiopterin dehydratase
VAVTVTHCMGSWVSHAPREVEEKASIDRAQASRYAFGSAGSASLFQKSDAMATSERTYSDEEVQERLTKELPHWYLEDGWIRRRFRTNSWKGTLMVINTVGHLSEAAWHHPDITASYAWVEVRLKNHAAKGITDKDFELAKKIEDVVHWQPGKEGGALEGTPAEDMRFAYIKYDKPKA